MWALLGIAFAAGPPVSGTWTVAESEEVLKTKHDAALKNALGQLPWAFRGLAKGQLTNAIDNCPVVELGLEGGRFRANCKGEPVFERVIGPDQEPVTGEDGKTYQVGLDMTAARVQLSFLGDNGGQRTRYAIEDGDLLLTKEIVSRWLDEPVEWTVRYRRVD